MNSLNSSFVKSCFLKILFFALACLGFQNSFGQNTIVEVPYSIQPGGRVVFSQMPDREHLLEQIDLARQESGLSVSGLALNINIPLSKFHKEKRSTNQQVLSLNLLESGLSLSFNLHAIKLSPEDYIVLKNSTDSLIINLNSVNYNPFLKDLEGEIKIELNDFYPFHNSALELKNFSVNPQRTFLNKNNDFGEAGNCQVNANCYENNLTYSAQRSAVLIQWRNGNFVGFCTGSLVVNSNYDNTPYLLTAEHCALYDGFATSTDFRDWVFFFNYESSGCESPSSGNGLNQESLTGAEWVARSDDAGGETGSDFLLLKLNNQIPNAYDAFFAGWNRSGLAPINGRCYHHPQGDIKKVSAYYYSPSLGSFGDNQKNTHWLVNWSSTAYGHGTTEEGSSGSALLDENGLIRGVLTGGSSSCSNRSGLDYFGTMAYSWTSNGSAAQNQLKPWLDPAHTGYLIMPPEQPTENPSALKVVPNPVESGNIQLVDVGNYDQEVTLELFGLSGQKVAFKKAAPIPGQGINLEVPRYVPGVYILQFKQGAELVTKKIVLL